MQQHTTNSAILAIALTTGSALAVQTLPSEFDSPGETLARQFSYFGGVADFGVSPSSVHVYAGGSLNVWADFQPDPIFNIAGFGIGTSTLTGADLNVPAGADVFSLTIAAPPEGAISVLVTLREDDTGDNFLDVGEDDEWETPPLLISPGTAVYNIPASDFLDINPGAGNDTQNFDTTGAMSFTLTFETRQSYPGGVIEVPVSFHIDHVGWYVGAQSATPSADINGDGIVDTADLGILLGVFGTTDPTADLNNDGVVDTADLGVLLGQFGTN